MDGLDLQEQLYAYHAEMCQVFAHPKRLRIINALREQELSVSELSQRLHTPMANLSQHLSLMRQRHILASRKEGNAVFYRLASPKLLLAFDTLREILLEQLRQDGALVRGA